MASNNAYVDLTPDQRQALIVAHVEIAAAFESDLREERYWSADRTRTSHEKLWAAFPEVFGPDSWIENDLLKYEEGC